MCLETALMVFMQKIPITLMGYVQNKNIIKTFIHTMLQIPQSTLVNAMIKHFKNTLFSNGLLEKKLMQRCINKYTICQRSIRNFERKILKWNNIVCSFSWTRWVARAQNTIHHRISSSSICCTVCCRCRSIPLRILLRENIAIYKLSWVYLCFYKVYIWCELIIKNMH